MRVDELITDKWVLAFRIMSADRVIVTLKKGVDSSDLAQQILPWGYELLREVQKNVYLVDLKKENLNALPQSFRRLSSLAIVLKVDRDYLDTEFLKLYP